ncbi:MAG: ABC transporter permease [Ignavibacteriaceae bacterium]
MFKNYLKVAFRNLLRFKTYSFINIAGLAIGIACCLLILLYIQNELSYDRFNKNADRIYRINTDLKFGATELALPVVPDLMGPLLKQDFPQVEEYTRIYNWAGKKLVKKGENFNTELGITYVDSTFFKVFTFPAVSGKTDKILNEPNTVVITETIAKKYFNTTDAAGKFIETTDNGRTLYKVTAVIKDMPYNSHFRFDFLFPMQNLNYDWGNLVSSNFHTYLLFKKGVNPKNFEKNFEIFLEKYAYPYAQKHLHVTKEEMERAGNKLKYSLIPVTDIHLYSKRIQEISPAGTIQYVYIFSAVALFILLIACINFMNLTTARSANRAREVGIRKVLGTERKNLVYQFLTESTITALIAVILAVIIVYHVLSFFNNISGKELDINNLYSSSILLFLISLPFIVGLMAGSYPAFFLSRFNPINIIKGKLAKGSKSGGLRSALVIFQFATSIILIIGTIIIYEQLSYIQNTNLGFQKEQVLIVNDAYNLGNNVDVFKNEMLNVPGVISGTTSGFLPIPSSRNFTVFYKEADQMAESGLTMQRWDIDYDYIKTLGIKLIKGRNFSKEFGSDSSSIILNEAAVKQLGYNLFGGPKDNPINNPVYTLIARDRILKLGIIGVVKNFHFESFHQDIGPLCFILQRSSGLVSFKVSASKIPAVIKEAETKWKKMASGMPFSYKFMDDSFNEVYKADRRVGVIALSFSSLAIIVACLGLFGLATFLAEQKTKEIGVRKVLGASVPAILLMLSKEFIKWIIIANFIAWPLAYYFMNKWLQEFAYRININWWLFVLAGSVALAIALVTVSFQAIKAATANPVKSLRYE